MWVALGRGISVQDGLLLGRFSMLSQSGEVYYIAAENQVRGQSHCNLVFTRPWLENVLKCLWMWKISWSPESDPILLDCQVSTLESEFWKPAELLLLFLSINATNTNLDKVGGNKWKWDSTARIVMWQLTLHKNENHLSFPNEASRPNLTQFSSSKTGIVGEIPGLSPSNSNYHANMKDFMLCLLYLTSLNQWRREKCLA